MLTASYIYNSRIPDVLFAIILYDIGRYTRERERIIFCLGYNGANKPKHQLVPDGAFNPRGIAVGAIPRVSHKRFSVFSAQRLHSATISAGIIYSPVLPFATFVAYSADVVVAAARICV